MVLLNTLEKKMIKEPDQKEINQLIYDCLWSLSYDNWLEGRLEMVLPKLEDALRTKHTCETCGNTKEY